MPVPSPHRGTSPRAAPAASITVGAMRLATAQPPLTPDTPPRLLARRQDHPVSTARGQASQQRQHVPLIVGAAGAALARLKAVEHFQQPNAMRHLRHKRKSRQRCHVRSREVQFDAPMGLMDASHSRTVGVTCYQNRV